MMRSDPVRSTLTPLAFVLALALVAGCAGSQRPTVVSTAAGAGSASHREATPVVKAPEKTKDQGEIAAALDRMGDEVKAFHAHVTTLSNPYYEGRGPGTRGNTRAAEYIEFYFKRFGLTPAFEQVETAADGSEIVSPGGSYLQPFTVPGETHVNVAKASFKTGHGHIELEVEKDFNPLGLGSNGDAAGDLAFVGYSIEKGRDGYSSYREDDDLTGKVAMGLRFEPMDKKGRSLWSDNDGWSSRAGLFPKINAAFEHGAEAFILVNAPGADDDRAAKIMSLRNSRFGRPFDKPVIMMSVKAADAMLSKADADGRSLMDLRRLADAGEVGVIDLPDVTCSIEIETERDRIETANVGGLLPGKGELADQYVVIGAHYDHLGYGYFGSRSPSHAGEVHAGADDNASGTSGVLLLANKLSKKYAQMPDDADARSILFLTFTGEEMGLLGSRHYVSEPSITLSQVDVMLNMDMIGRLRHGEIELGGVGTAKRLLPEIQPILDASHLTIKTSKSGQGPSDHASFDSEGVPVLFFFTGMTPEYHTVFDVASTINHAGAVRVADLVGDVALALATDPRKLEHVDAPSPSRMGGVRRAKVRLGIAPGSYADDEAGVLVGDVYPETTAAKAGMQKGDRIIRWGGEELAGVIGMMERLADHEPGDKVDVVVVRDGKELTLHLVMLERKGDQ